ncbi:hypothetical protein Pla108_37490 [Botrimarina colliarenosi]|uniref:Autotransporter-associated beta strand repeat protein n=1 Tax=Botrimarina colliarenosi TaxID=2528001 RepID=A0A5C6A3W6_9BACT|nr:hypothetical protein [Botrimarina colliarenosi]TWT94037.1 hypothetical protein Pla108_37490 [Botrimarina colliarenosi]
MRRPFSRHRTPTSRLTKALRRSAIGAATACSIVMAPDAACAINWDDAGNSASKLWSDNGNWSPDGAVPVNADIFIGNLANAANDRTLFDIATQIGSLTITNGADVVNSTDDGATAANTRELIVNGATTVGDNGSSIVIYGRPGDGLDTNTLTINSGGTVSLNSQAGVGTAVVEVDSGLLDVNTGGEIIGNGRLDLETASAGAVFTALSNDGEITASSLGSIFLFAPPATTLQITATSPDARFDWDGGGNGVLNANGNATLDIDVSTFGDSFDGTMNLATGSTIDIQDAWSLSSGTINANTPAFGFVIIGQDPSPGAAARIAGGVWAMTGGVINVDDAWDSLQFDSAVTASAGAINNSGTMIFNADATFLSGVDFNMIPGGDSHASLIVNATVNIDTPDFNLDGQGLVTNVTTINAGGNLDLDLGVGADEDFDHTINLNGGELDVTTADNDWSLTSNGQINAAGGATSTINGETFVIDGDIDVTGDSTLRINAASEYSPSARVVIAAGSVLDHGVASYSGGTYNGGGVFKKGTATIVNNTTWGVDTIDLDDGTTTVNNGAALTINANSIDDSGDGIDTTITVEDTGSLTVNLAGGGDVVFDNAGRLNYNGNASGNLFLPAPAGGSALRFDSGSQLNVTGDGTSNARIKLSGGALNINSVGEDFRLQGGTLVAGATNEIDGGVINGPGELQISSGAALRGSGVINASINADGTAQVIAEGGQLDINGGVTDVGTIGTNGVAAVLNVTNPWNTNVTNSVSLQFGALTGSTITNNGVGGVNGKGTINARVINNSSITASDSGTLVVDNPLNDWDGTTGTGSLNASKATLELRDNAPVLFTGTVDAGLGVVYANGFELEFEPASTLRLFESTYRSTNATDIGGTVIVDSGARSRINVGGTVVFENGSSTTLNADLEVENLNTVIAVGASFAGAGELRNVNGSRMTLLDGATVGVQVTNDGDLEIAGSGTGRGDVADFVQSVAGLWNVDIAGAGVGAFDRIVASGIAEVDGTLSLDLLGGFNPGLGSSFTVLSAAGGVLGAFADLDTGAAPLGDGLVWEAVYNPTTVQVRVELLLPGDFNNDGMVDAADYTVYRDNLGLAVTLPGDPTPGSVAAADHAVWAANYGAVAPAPAMAFATAASVPEPAAAGLVLIAMAGLATRRRG